MTLLTQAVSSSQPLTMEPKSWITEWTGPHGADVILNAITEVGTPLVTSVVGIVVQYLRKNDVFGLEKVETAAGGKEELTKLVGKYNPQKPLTFEIDDWMQAPLSKYFNAEALQAFPSIQKITELYSLYWCPAGITANNAEQFAKKHGTGFGSFDLTARLEHGDSPTAEDCWIAFPNNVLGRNKTVQEQEALIPAGFEFPHVQDTIFCVFMKYACTGVRILSDNPWTYTCCHEQTLKYKLAIGGYSGISLDLPYRDCDAEICGVAPVWRRNGSEGPK